jgi:hypothetical protein
MRLGRFREVTLLQVTPEELLNHMSAQMARTTVGSDKELFLYEARARHGLLDGRSASELGI